MGADSSWAEHSTHTEINITKRESVGHFNHDKTVLQRVLSSEVTKLPYSAYCHQKWQNCQKWYESFVSVTKTFVVETSSKTMQFFCTCATECGHCHFQWLDPVAMRLYDITLHCPACSLRAPLYVTTQLNSSSINQDPCTSTHHRRLTLLKETENDHTSEDSQ